MGVFGRLSDIVTANVHDMLDKAENPEKMLKQIIREMEEAIGGAKRNLAQAMAGQKKLDKELQTNKRLRDEWQRKAQEAVGLDNDELARRALSRKKEHETLIESLQDQHGSAQQAVDSMRKTLKALDAKLADAKRRKQILVARKKTAQAQIAAQDGLAKGAAKASAFAKFDRMEEQVTDLESEAEAMQEISEEERASEEELEKLDEGDDIELELAKLKAQAKKGKADKSK